MILGFNQLLRSLSVLSKTLEKIVNMMIYKEPGNVKIHRLHIIHLYEPDQSTLWDEKWSKSLRKAVNDKTLNSGQLSGLPRRDSTAITFVEKVCLE